MFLVGRRAELASIRAGLDEHRVLAIVGPAGVGKTTIARALVEERSGVLCRVEECGDEADLLAAVARALSVATTGDTARAVDRTLASVPLLVIDGAEHLGREVDRLVERFLAAAPSLRCLITTREPLGARQTIEVATFDVGDDLFELWERAVRRELPEYRLAHDDRDELHRLLLALDGLPLAIELAAARRATLTIGALATELAAGLAVLRDRRRPTDRHASLQAALDASYVRLNEASRGLLAALAVFPDTFAASAVRTLLVEDDPAWLDRFESLVDQSWVVREVADNSMPLFRLLRTVRGYVRERDPEAVARAEARFVTRLSELASSLTDDPSLLMQHASNLRLASERSSHTDLLCALGELVPYGLATARDAELIDRALATEAAPAKRARLLFAKALFARASRAIARVRDAAEEAFSLAEQTGQRTLAGRALHVLGAVAIEASDRDPRELLERAKTFLAPDDPETALVTTHLAIIEQRAGRHREAAELLRSALPIARRDSRATAILQSVLGAVYGELHEPEEGRRCLEEAIALSAGRDVRTFAYASTCYGALLHAGGDLVHAAARLRDAVLAWTRASGELYAAFSEETLAVVLAELGDRRQARVHLEHAIAELSGNGYAFALLGEAHLALLDLEDDDEARARARYARVLAEVTEQNPFAEAIRTLGAAFDPGIALPADAKKMDVRVAVRRVQQVRAPRPRIPIARDGSAFGSPLRSIRHRPQLVRLLAALAETPGAPVSVETLVARVWPGERILESAARTRLWAAVRRLRAIGLGDALMQTEGGYRLDPERVRVVDAA